MGTIRSRHLTPSIREPAQKLSQKKSVGDASASQQGSGERVVPGEDLGTGQSAIWVRVTQVETVERRAVTRGGHLREGQREVEALPQATEHDERTGREGACGHLTARALESAARGALAAKAAIGRVGAGAPVAADARHAASSFGVQLAVFPCRAGPGKRTTPRPRPAHALRRPAPQGRVPRPLNG